MTSRLVKALVFGALTGLFGVAVSLLPFIFDLEENLGLELLFKLRGPRQAPSDVVIVSIDKASADKLRLPDSPEKWPRSLHGRLTENLAREGAAVIAFDILFDEARSESDDRLFAESIARARNIVLCECLKCERIPLTPREGSTGAEANVQKLVLPIAPLAESALALAPFPLPKVPVKVSQYWTFKTDAGNMPTLPIVVFQIFSLEVYEEFVGLLEKVSPSQAAKLPRHRDSIIAARGIEKLVRTIRDIFEEDPSVGTKMLEAIGDRREGGLDPVQARILAALIAMYQGSDSQYLQFYGPPGTVATVSYDQVLRLTEDSSPGGKKFDFKGKAVFVGLSERLRPEQKDGFHTVYSGSSGLDISGVEIAATAFANLLEGLPVRPLTLFAHLATVFSWGLVIGIFCRLSPTIISVSGAVLLGVLYALAAQYHFKTTVTWYPLVMPLFIQTPLALFGAVIWKYAEANRERRNIKKAFGYYLPNEVVDQLSKSMPGIDTSSRVLFGTCLYTDAEHYTSLSETMDPKDLGSFMNKYYEVVFKPVRRHGGVVSNVIGDSMLSIWVTAQPESPLKNKACLAALDILSAVNRFNQSSNALQLPTRIGLHTGQILLGNIGAANHYEYRPVGDIVNTATRLEGLNKVLGTSILLSGDVLSQQQGFLTREMGQFLFVGKSRPLAAHELICRAGEADERQKAGCAVFAEALAAFRGQCWEEATGKFRRCIDILGRDKPSDFYIEQCRRLKESPPGESWDGVVRLSEK